MTTTHLKIVARSLAPLLAALALTGNGCHEVSEFDEGPGTDSSTDSDSDTDSGSDSDSDSDSDLWDWECSFALDTTCADYEDAPQPYSLEFAAAEFEVVDADYVVEFVRAPGSPTMFLAELVSADGADPIAFFWHAWTEEYGWGGIVDPPAEPLRAVDLAMPSYLEYDPFGIEPPDAVLGYAAVALLCGETACALYGYAMGIDGGLAGFVPVPGGEVPLAESRAMTWIPPTSDDIDAPGRVCVAGDGAACFDGTTWTEWVAPGGEPLNAVTAELDEYGQPQGLWVAGDGGRVATNRDGAWAEVDSGTAMNLTAISARDGIWAAGGAGGFVFGDDAHVVRCLDGFDYTAMFVHESYTDWTSPAVTALAVDRVYEIWGDAGGFRSCVGDPGFASAPRNADLGPDADDITIGYALTPDGMYLRTEHSGGSGK